MSEDTFLGFSLSEGLTPEDLKKISDKVVKKRDSGIELRQKELEDKLNELVMEFQKKENVILIPKYISEEWNTRPVKLRLVFDSEKKLFS